MNAFFVKGSASGSILLTGAGAGGDATASAVMADLMQACISSQSEIVTQPSLECIQHNNQQQIQDLDQLESEFYLRINTKDEPGAWAKISQILANYEISLETVIQIQGL